jgi:3-hydroxypropanoate dehydrogenase
MAATATDRAPAPAEGGELPAEALDVLFRAARSQNGWLPRAVADEKLRELYELWKWGPTASNGSPARVIFVRTAEGKSRLAPALSPGNLPKVMGAPVTAIIGYDVEFHHHLPRLFAHSPDAYARFQGERNRAHAATTAFRNGTLQGAYLMLAARALGLDCGPMSGFDEEAVNRSFWAGTSIRANFLCNLGYGDPSKLFARHPRLSFDECCTLT